MRRWLHLFWMLSLCGAGLTVAHPALAQTAVRARPAAAPAARASDGGTADALAERLRLRTDLARVQAEIDRLKKEERGLRSDYQLRARLADAEAMARRLTELDAQLQDRTPGGRPARPAPPIGDEPIASPTDGPAELEAKADILADQAHRAQAQAVALKGRIDQLRGRRELRRRVRQLDSDPFAPLEGSKRRVLTGGATPTGQGTTLVDNRTNNPAPAAPSPGPSIGLTTATSSPASAGSTPTPPTPESSSPAPSFQAHDLLDPATLAQARKTDAGGAPTADLEAMERALAALNARAQYLDAQAKLLRAKSQTR